MTISIANLEALATADLAKLSAFAGLGNELALVLEGLFPTEAPVIALVMAGLSHAPTLVADAEKLLSDIGTLTTNAQPATPPAP